MGVLIALLLVGLSATAVIMVSAGIIWLVRSIMFRSSVIASAADLLLSGFAVAAALWTFLIGGSIAMGLWCYYLIQALNTLIPAQFGTGREPLACFPSGDRFQQAQRSAEAALEQLIGRSR